MNRGQRKMLAWVCVLMGVMLHFYVGDWRESDTGLLGREIGYDYRPGTPLSGFREYQGESHWKFGRHEGSRSQYSDHRGLMVLLLGIVLPGVLFTVGGFVYLGGRPTQARPAQAPAPALPVQAPAPERPVQVVESAVDDDRVEQMAAKQMSENRRSAVKWTCWVLVAFLLMSAGLVFAFGSGC